MFLLLPTLGCNLRTRPGSSPRSSALVGRLPRRKRFHRRISTVKLLPSAATRRISGLLGSAKLPEPQARPAQNAEILDLNRNESAASSEPSSYVSVPPQASDPPLPSEAFTSGGAWHEADTAFVFRPQREVATNAFTARETEAGPAQGNLQSGPSEFTRIVSGGIRNLESVEEPPDAAGQQDFLDRLGPPSFRAPALPSQVPQAPAFPQTFLPPARTPALPQTPQLEAAAPKVAAVPWTLILILNGLFLVAVLLVLYFALKR